MHTIGELLKQWRQRRQLSQLDLAISADVSPRHVSLIETGKSNPSADMIVRLAGRLDVPLRDRNRLLLAAGFAPRYAERPLDGQALSIARHAIDRVLRGHEPYPAVVLDHRRDERRGRGILRRPRSRPITPARQHRSAGVGPAWPRVAYR